MIWLNGQALDAAEARIDPADRGLLLGDGVFETVRILAGRPMHLHRHLARMRAGAAVLGFACPWTDAEIEAGIAGVLCGSCQDAAARLTLTRGPAPRGLLPSGPARPTLLIAAHAHAADVSPVHAIVARCTRRNEHSPLSRIKSLNYLDSILVRQEAVSRGAGEALLLNTQGRFAEASAGNVFVVLDGSVCTPPVADGALPGIARALILEAGLAVERSLGPGDVLACEAAFVTSSLGVRPLASVDGSALREPTAALLQAADCLARDTGAARGGNSHPNPLF